MWARHVARTGETQNSSLEELQSGREDCLAPTVTLASCEAAACVHLAQDAVQWR